MAVCSRNCRQDLPLRLPYTESLKRGECHASFLAAATKYRRFNSAVPVVSLFAYPWGRHRITKQRLFFFFWHSRVVCIKTKALPSYIIPLQSAFGSTFQYWFFQYGLKSIYNKPKFQPFWFFFFLYLCLLLYLLHSIFFFLSSFYLLASPPYTILPSRYYWPWRPSIREVFSRCHNSLCCSRCVPPYWLLLSAEQIHSHISRMFQI